MTGEWQLADAPSTPIIKALQSAPHAIAELLVKNLAMSTAMAISHRRADNEEQAQGSDRVARRTATLIEKVELAEVYEIATQMRNSAMMEIMYLSSKNGDMMPSKHKRSPMY